MALDALRCNQLAPLGFKLRVKYAFLPRAIPAWNALPQVVVEADSSDTFKRYLSLHQQFRLSASCIMYIVHICSTTHLFIAGFYSTHLLIPPVAYYPSKDVATILSRSRFRMTHLRHLNAAFGRQYRLGE